MTPLIAPSLPVKAPTPPRAPAGDDKRNEAARFVLPEDGSPGPVPQTAATLAAMTAMGGKMAVAGRMQARRLARKLEEEEERETSESASATAQDDLPPITPQIGRPMIDLDAEVAALRKARKSDRGMGPLTAFLAQHIGQSGAFAASLRAPLHWLIAAYVRHQAPDQPPPKKQTLTVS